MEAYCGLFGLKPHHSAIPLFLYSSWVAGIAHIRAVLDNVWPVPVGTHPRGVRSDIESAAPGDAVRERPSGGYAESVSVKSNPFGFLLDRRHTTEQPAVMIAQFLQTARKVIFMVPIFENLVNFRQINMAAIHH